MTNTDLDPCAVARRSIDIMATGSLADFEEVVHPAAHNREDVDEPPASRGRGPAAFYATALWLRGMFSDLKWEEHDVVQDGDLVVMHVTMSGRHTGTFVSYGPDARPRQAFPATGRTGSSATPADEHRCVTSRCAARRGRPREASWLAD